MSNKLKKFLSVNSIRSPHFLDTKGEDIVFSFDKSGVAQLWKQNIPSSQLTPLSNYENFILSIETYPKDQKVMFTMSEGGDEKTQIYLYTKEELVNLTNRPHAAHYIGSFSKDGSKIYYTSNARNAANFDIEVLEIATQEKTILYQNSDNYNFPDSLSPDNKYFAYRKLKAEDDQSLWLLDLETKEPFEVSNSKAKFFGSTWLSDSQGFYLITNLDSEFNYLAYYDLKSKSLSKVLDLGWDIETISLSKDDKYLALILNENGISKCLVYDTKTWLEESLPEIPKGEIAYYDVINWSEEGYKLIFVLSSGTRASNVWLLDIDNKSLKQISDNGMDVDIESMCVEPTLHSFASFDGLEVPYWLYVPKGKEVKDLPVLIEIHGGPEGQEKAAYNELIQYFVSEGIAVCAPNVRGSTGYGKTYTHLDDVEKRLDSVKDIEWLVKDLVDKKIADPSKIAVSGTSYGGFMALSCASRLSELFCCSVDNVGMYNLVTFLENTAPYRRKHRESEYGSLDTDRDILFEVSPVAKVDDITGPLMVIHGRNDPRVPVSEAIQVVDYLQEKGVYVEFLCYEDEGHGLHKLNNKIDCYSKMSKFIKQNMNI